MTSRTLTRPGVCVRADHPRSSRDWQRGLGLAAAAAVLLGLVTGWWTPRGPVTTAAALVTIGRTGLVGALTANGPPPYTDVRDYESVTLNEGAVNAYDHSPNAEGAGGFAESIFVQECSLMEQLHVGAAALDVLVAMYPGLQDIDFRVDVPRLEVPVYLVQGRYEARGRAELSEQWFTALSAPSKQLVVLETSGHRPLFEQPEQFATVMTETVLAQTRTGD